MEGSEKYRPFILLIGTRFFRIQSIQEAEGWMEKLGPIKDLWSPERGLLVKLSRVICGPNGKDISYVYVPGSRRL